MPQFDLSTAAPQIVWLAIIFALLYAVVKTLLPGVVHVQETRARMIAEDLATAEAAKHAAEAAGDHSETALGQARASANTAIEDAKASANAAIAAQLAAADARIDADATAASERIGAARTAALARLDDIASGATADIVERLTGRRPGADAVTAAMRN